ncbi:hypothetical protein GGQ84_001838 [Desulfitispora alkaliphila]|uniref:YlzJ-like family protein n=1 Tax=Desulfitispora alkaliphila TaxID=622674 RepID=UPI003D1A30C3
MVLYTPVPVELLGIEEYYSNKDNKSNKKEVLYGNVRLEVELTGENSCKVNRIISTDPNDYLRTDISPGAVINLQPELAYNNKN